MWKWSPLILLPGVIVLQFPFYFNYAPFIDSFWQREIKHVCNQALWEAQTLMFSPASWVFLFTFINMYGYMFFLLTFLPSGRSAGASELARCLWLLQTVSVMGIFRERVPSRGKDVKTTRAGNQEEHKPMNIYYTSHLNLVGCWINSVFNCVKD